MAVIIDELLLMASARNLQDVEPLPLNIQYIVEEALERLAPAIETSGAEIQLPEIWPDALGYGPWVEQVWVNDLSNAIKYGGHPEGGLPPRIWLGAERVTCASKDGAYVRFWVQDNGPGLPEEAQARVFEAFCRLQDRTRAEGHGLGLSIVQRIVSKLGGTVGIESEVGEGSLFHFTLPAEDGVDD
jgi:signal transduction histidine kinase